MKDVGDPDGGLTAERVSPTSPMAQRPIGTRCATVGLTSRAPPGRSGKETVKEPLRHGDDASRCIPLSLRYGSSSCPSPPPRFGRRYSARECLACRLIFERGGRGGPVIPFWRTPVATESSSRRVSTLDVTYVIALLSSRPLRLPLREPQENALSVVIRHRPLSNLAGGVSTETAPRWSCSVKAFASCDNFPEEGRKCSSCTRALWGSF